MATYVNNLRLTELATGEGSGTWGTTTNTSLELIGEALGFNTQDCFSSDADATTTVADGATDPARAFYFKVTSSATLTATRTLTIAPNTVSRVMFIENATTGSQSINISQGSGANVTIATGKTAVVYLDGAGSGAAVVDAMAGVDPGVTDTLAEVLTAGNTTGGTNVELTTTDKVQFRDSAIFLNSSADGQLDIVADTEVQIAATTIDINGNADVSGTAGIGGVLTANAGVVVDNITIDGTEIDLSSGDLTLDVAGDIVLDADGGEVIFKDGGTSIGHLKNSSSDFVVQALVADKDIIFRGSDSDGESVVTALTLDMSDAGTATFNHDIKLGDNGKTIFGAGSDLEIFHDGTDSFISESNSSGSLFIKATHLYLQNSSGQDALNLINGNAFLKSGGSTKLETTSTGINVTGTAVTDGLTVDGTASISSSSASDVQLTLTNTDAGASHAPTLDMRRNSASPADDDQLGRIRFRGENDAGENVTYASISVLSADVTDGSEDGTFRITTKQNGADKQRVSILSAETVFNEQTGDIDFRVESDGKTHALFVDAGNDRVGIGSSSPDTSLHISEPSTATATVRLEQTDTTLVADQAVGVIEFEQNDAAGAGVPAKFGAFGENANAAVGLRFYTGTGATANERLRIASDGAATFTGDSNSTVLIEATSGNDASLLLTEAGTGVVGAEFIYDGGDNALLLKIGNNSAFTALKVTRDDGSISTPTLGTSNLKFGVNAGNSITSGGNFNTLLGDEAGTALTTGDDNVAVGYNALKTEDEHGNNVAIGSGSLKNLNAGTHAYNVGVGVDTGVNLTTGVQNTFIGALAGDALTDADFNVAVGTSALSADTLGSNSVGLGRNALASQNFTSATNTYNVAVGTSAGLSVSTGVNNTLIGGLAGDALTDADQNVAVGAGALTNDTLGSKSTALGRSTLANQNFTSATDSNNTAVGYFAGFNVTTGRFNSIFGANAGDAITTGFYNTALGYEALSSNQTSNNNVAIGYQALRNNTAANNVAVGAQTMDANTSGEQNTAVGREALNANTEADNNVALGYRALKANTTGASNVAIGSQALDANTTASNNTAVGDSSLTSNTEGTGNTAAGKDSLKDNSTGNNNSAFGENALANNTTASSNSAFGQNALLTSTTAANNTAIGHDAMRLTTTGGNNVAVGLDTLRSNTEGTYNTAVGSGAGISISTGQQNTLIGGLAGDALTTANENTAIGYGSLSADTQGKRSVAVGKSALGIQNFTSAVNNYNVAVGYDGGKSITIGTNNTIIGGLAGDALTDADHNAVLGYAALTSDTLGSRSIAIGSFALGSQNFTSATQSYNVAIGYNAGNDITAGVQNTLVGGLAGDSFTTGTQNTLLGYNTGVSAVGANGRIAIGVSVVTTSDQRITVGYGGNTASLELDGSDTSWAAASDERLKENIVSSTAGLSFINDLRPVTYNWKKAKDVPSDLPQYVEGSNEPCLGQTYGTELHGFIAQEVKAALDNHPEVKEGQSLWQTDETTVQTLAPAALVPMLVKAIQEQQALIESLTARIATLEG